MATSTKRPTSPTEQAQSVRDQVLGSLRQGQQFAVDAAGSWAELVGKAIPAGFTPVTRVPTRDDLQTVVSTSFGFAEELLAIQRDFAEGVLAAVPAPAPAAV